VASELIGPEVTILTQILCQTARKFPLPNTPDAKLSKRHPFSTPAKNVALDLRFTWANLSKREDCMKKLFTLLVMLASFAFIGSWEEAKPSTNASLGSPQVRIQIGQRRRYRNRDYYPRGERVGYGRVYTRVVQHGWRRYQETYRVRYLPNGETQTFLVSRVRLN